MIIFSDKKYVLCYNCSNFEFFVMNSEVIFFDTEVNNNHQVCDIGAVGACKEFHKNSLSEFRNFIDDCDFLCGHNILSHDNKYLKDFFSSLPKTPEFIDTLYLSTLLFPHDNHHCLLKDDKIEAFSINNPYIDAKKARNLFIIEEETFRNLNTVLKSIYCSLLYNQPQFSGFFKYIGYIPCSDIENTIKNFFASKICTNADLAKIIKNYPIELAYSLSLIASDEGISTTSEWLIKNFPKIENVLHILRETPCLCGCKYCNQQFNTQKKLQQFFGFNEYRKYDGEPLQEKAVQCAVRGKSLLAIFPTGGGKSITFQVPALISGETMSGLTIVIAPLASLMIDQVSNLEKKGIFQAVTINSLLNPLERTNAIKSVKKGKASLLYISPEMLRSNTIRQLLLSRNIVRFVIDEAHCLSAWGHDFRVDYLYIGEFIRNLQEQKKINYNIPVSCFTATAKPKVISDICDYFRKELNIELEIFSSNATRKNLHYKIINTEDDQKYNILRNILSSKSCPTIIYCSYVKDTENLAQRLCQDGFSALAYHGKMDSNTRIKVQDSFIKEQNNIIVATSAFGMGVDKENVGLVIHWNISNSIENYIQESGRAGRKENIDADCYILYNDDDLNKHFSLLRHSMLTFYDIQQIWRTIKQKKESFSSSISDLAKEAGWSEQNVYEQETKVKIAISVLERAGYIKRLPNVVHIYATSINVKNMVDADKIIDCRNDLSKEEKEKAHCILSFLISRKSREYLIPGSSQVIVDDIANTLGIKKEEIIYIVNILRSLSLLSDDQDMFSDIDCKKVFAQKKLENLIKLELFLLEHLQNLKNYSVKEINSLAVKKNIPSNTCDINTILNLWIKYGYVKKITNNDAISIFESSNDFFVEGIMDSDNISPCIQTRANLSLSILDYLYSKYEKQEIKNNIVTFSLCELFTIYNNTIELFKKDITLADIQSALLYLHKMQVLKLNGGFVVFYNKIKIQRLILDNRRRYTRDDYKSFNEYYKQKIQQIHIIGEYVNLMIKNQSSALSFVTDYFKLEYKKFQDKYFKGRERELEKSITPQKYNKLFGSLSEKQKEIIDDDQNKNIIVAAGPGSGKTRLLVHKLASLLLLEEVRAEQLLMLTFSRSAATEFKKRLIDLIGSAAYYVEIKTFHSYCFDLVGRIGNLEETKDIVKQAVLMLNNDLIEKRKITKKVLVIDEAQDINADEFSLIEALKKYNEDMKIIAVGDDDQNIFEFRGSKSKFFKDLEDNTSKHYDLIDNYRSDTSIVNLANCFVKTIPNRLKTQSIKSRSSQQGNVFISKCVSPNLIYKTLDTIKDTFKKGSCCVLSRTNEEAYQIAWLLKQNHYDVKFISSSDNLNLYNLYEIRWFINKLRSQQYTRVNLPEIWKKCKDEFFEIFKNSSCLLECKFLIQEFEKTNSNTMYLSYLDDFENFVKDSKYDDFINMDNNPIWVSTIHKSKGREFDYVYMTLNDYNFDSDESKRVLYVGMTRAKHNLYINYNNDILDSYNNVEGCTFKYDTQIYPDVDNILLSLGYKDVSLGCFKTMQHIIQSSRCADPLNLVFDTHHNLLWLKLQNMNIFFSKSFQITLKQWIDNGYTPYFADIRFIVYWKDRNTDEELLIALPNLYLRKNR